MPSLALIAYDIHDHAVRRRPPRDPFNALLSYGYALAGADALAAVQRLGLDPALGFLHSLYPGRHALSLDALECVRPLVDRMAVALLAPGALARDDFSDDASHGCRLSKRARGELIQAWYALRRDTAVPRLHAWANALRGLLGEPLEAGQNEHGSAM
ncbi:MAG: CRISPR-associated endonuclease Cas1 [Proteobacteria bacterium]|nr:CRISPR-associated endonuclease Cas1 [Pseudomonadota bacterium]